MTVMNSFNDNSVSASIQFEYENETADKLSLLSFALFVDGVDVKIEIPIGNPRVVEGEQDRIQKNIYH